MPSRTASRSDRTRADAGLEEAFALHERVVFGFARRLLGDAAAAEDVAAEAFARLLIELRSGARPRSVRAWLLRVTRNLALNVLEHEKVVARHRAAGSPGGGRSSSEPWTDAARAELGAALEAALATLSPEFRETVVLCDVLGVSHEEAASVCGCSLKTISSRLARARARLRAALGPMLEE